MKKSIKLLFEQLNIVAQCKKYNVPLRQCPQFLFTAMGIAIIITTVSTYVIGISYSNNPEMEMMVALIVIGLTIILLVISFIILQSFEQLAETNRLKTEFISIVSHQIRSPLTNLKWIVEILMSGILGKTEGKEAEYYKILKENLERMQKLVSELLTVSRIEATKLVLKKEEFSMENLARDLVTEFEPLAKSSNIKLISDFESGLPKVVSDPFQTLQVLENLLYNAIRYIGSPIGGKQGEIILKLSREGKFVLCQVQDNGIGIPKDDQKYIFQKFFRADNVRRYQTSGSGLGLYIAKNIIDKSGGRMGFSSSENKGTTFWFKLPIAKAVDSQSQKSQKSQ